MRLGHEQGGGGSWVTGKVRAGGWVEAGSWTRWRWQLGHRQGEGWELGGSGVRGEVSGGRWVEADDVGVYAGIYSG